MNDHSVYIEAHIADDRLENVGIAVLCSCGAILSESEDPAQPQVLLDDAVDAAWHHRDSAVFRV